MNRTAKALLELTVLALELAGACLIGYGLWRMWEPVGWVFAGMSVLYCGNCLYRSIKENG